MNVMLAVARGGTTDERQRLKEQERENRERRRSNDVWVSGRQPLWRPRSGWMRWHRHCGSAACQVTSITATREGAAVRIFAYMQWLEETDLLTLMGNTGDSHDNLMTKSINGLYKAEVIYCQS